MVPSYLFSTMLFFTIHIQAEVKDQDSVVFYCSSYIKYKALTALRLNTSEYGKTHQNILGENDHYVEYTVPLCGFIKLT
jgi:hypothetical protein